MASFILSSSSTADISKEHFEARDIRYVCFHYRLNGTEYADDLGQSMSLVDFYRAMTEGADTETSQVNIQEYLEFFEPFLQEGKDILHVELSSGISGSSASALNAARIARERYPERKIYVVDSLAASAGLGMLMDKLADLRDGGMGIDQLYGWAEANKLRLHHWFFSTDLTFFVKGGRVSKTAGVFGGMLGICPLLDVDVQGRLIPRFKIRGKNKVIQQIVKMMEQHADDGFDYSEKCYLSHSACIEDAKAVAELVEARFPKMQGKVEINDIGTTIGSHTGPGTVALFFWGAMRE
ncbi:MAG: DegV family protein [Ruminococcaceae bacterium]|nr:DegV family protein [Oscillospiraceae bacterium]